MLTNCELSPKAKLSLSKAVGNDFVLRSVHSVSESELAQVKIMLIDTIQNSGRKRLSKEIVGQMPRLELVQSTRAGVDAIDFEQLPERVTICGNIGAYSDPIAEHVIGMVLYLAKYLGGRNDKLKSGIVDYSDSVFLKGKTIGVIGAGGIGKAVAKIAKCFGMKTLGVNTSGRPVQYCDETFGMGKLDHVLSVSDVVVLSLPLTVKTLHIIDDRRLRLMKKNCILINVGRGYVINEKALYNHLKKNPEFKCGLDVWWHYPKGNEKFAQKFPFLKLTNFLGTPHVSGYVPEEKDIALDFAVQNVVRFAKNRRLRGVVNRKDYAGLRELIKSLKTS
jgi:glycerate dehydrogenase